MCDNDKITEKAKDNKEVETTNMNPWVCGTIIIAIIAVICCLIGCFMPKFTFPNADNIVITFLGALATFVVVSNYVQILEIKKSCDRKIEEFEKMINDAIYSKDSMSYEIEIYFKERIALFLNSKNLFGKFQIAAKNVVEYHFTDSKLLKTTIVDIKRTPREGGGNDVSTTETMERRFEINLLNNDYKELS